MAWTSDKIKQLTKLWNKGKSTVEIARELGISKNAVVGKVHRLGLDARPSPIRVPKTIVPTPAKSTPKSHQKEKTSLLDLKINSCRWPYGEPGTADFHFCGKDAQTGKPYCPEHCKIAYTSLKELAMESARNKKENKLTIVLPEEVTATASSRKNAGIKSSNSASGKEESKHEEKVSTNPAKKAGDKVAKTPAKTPAKPEKKAALAKATIKPKAEKKAADKPVKASAKAEPAKKVAASEASAKTPAAAKKAGDKAAKTPAKTEPAKTPAKPAKKTADKPVKASAKAEPAKKAAASEAFAKTPAKAEKKAEKKEKTSPKAQKEPSVSKKLLFQGVKSVKEKLLKGTDKRK